MFFKSSGILGINARNLLYIRPYNKKKAIRLADNKLQTKHFLSARGIPVPKLYSTIRTRHELDKFDFNALPDSFVLKPNFGYGGEGIIPIVERDHDMFIKPVGGGLSKENLYDHISDILDGRFSITDLADIAFFEQRIVCDELIGKFAYCGLPDIRIVVHNLIPVMAMLRLPTRESGGLANLHQGAVGVGIDIARGEMTHIVQGSKIISQIPGVEADIRSLKIPNWNQILLIASKVQFITNLGYMAVDIVLDKNSGPILLEINARAGLAVQIANLSPLRKRLERIEGVKVPTPEKGVRIAQDIFGNKIEKEIKQVSGKSVIGIEEDVEIIMHGATRRLSAQIDTDMLESILDREVARESGLIHAEDDDATIKVKFILAGIRLQTLVKLTDLSKQDYKMIVGKRDLNNFLVDPSKNKKPVSLPKKEPVRDDRTKKWPNFYDIDRRIVDVDQQIKLLHHLTPLNLNEERARFFQDFLYHPQFEYPELKFDPYKLREDLEAIRMDDSPLGQIYAHKKEEIFAKISLLEYIGSEGFTRQSERLFGIPDEDLVRKAEKDISQYPLRIDEGEDNLLESGDVRRDLESALKKAGLSRWKVREKEFMVANVLAGKKNVLFMKKGLRISGKRLQSIIAHEIETHVFTAENGKMQPYNILNRGLAHYLKTQEGLAVYSQSRVIGGESRIATLVLAIQKALNSGFASVFERLKDLGIDDERAFLVAAKVKRGLEDTSLPGAFTKDIVYFQGFLEIEEYITSGKNVKDLFIGKLSLDDMDLLKKVPNLKTPKFVPEWVI